MLSPVVISLLQSQGGVSGSGSFGESTCEGRGLCLTLQVVKACWEAEICRGSPIPNPQTDCVFSASTNGSVTA